MPAFWWLDCDPLFYAEISREALVSGSGYLVVGLALLIWCVDMLIRWLSSCDLALKVAIYFLLRCCEGWLYETVTYRTVVFPCIIATALF